jgi:hypothetical protein
MEDRKNVDIAECYMNQTSSILLAQGINIDTIKK